MESLGGDARQFAAPRPCPLCVGSDRAPLLRVDAGGATYDVVTCGACGLRFTTPLPTAQTLAALYEDEYYGGRRPSVASWDSLRLMLHAVVLRHRRRSLGRRHPGRLLDVGCGDGDFLAHLAARGWHVRGCEFSPAAVERARAKGLEVDEGTLTAADLADRSFDAVTIWHVLEHLPHPTRDLAVARRILRDDGVLVIEVPNSASPTFRLCRERWFPLDVPRHLQHFTPATMESLLARSGFRIVRRVDFHPFDFVLAAISFVHRLGVLGPRRGSHYFVTDYRRAAAPAKALFLALGLPILLGSVPYSLLATLLGGHGETLRLVAEKAEG